MKTETKHPDFIKIMHLIESSHKPDNLINLAELIYMYDQEHADGFELWAGAHKRLKDFEYAGAEVQEVARVSFRPDENYAEFMPSKSWNRISSW
jgi:hypothetical protein